MLNKIDELKISILNSNPTIILITETWLTDQVPDSLIQMPGYVMIRKDRGTVGGGVCIFVKSKIEEHKVHVAISQNFQSTGAVESLWLEIKISNIKFLVACVYRPKQKTTEEHNQALIQDIEKAMMLKEPVFIMGDFNYPEIDWDKLEIHPHNQCSYNFLESYKNHRGYQHINFPTRYRNDQMSLLDLLISNEKKLLFDIQQHAPLGKSDHLVLSAKTQFQIITQATRKIYKRQFWKADYAAVNDTLNQQLHHLSNTISIDNFYEAITTTINTHIPIKPLKVNPQKPWLTREVFKEIQKKRNLWHKYQNNKSEERYQKYQQQNNKANIYMHSARKTYEHNLLANNKQFYSYINHTLNSKHTNFSIIDKTSQQPLESSLEIAECFAEQFESVFTKLTPNTTVPMLPLNTYSGSEINNIVFTSEKVEYAIQSLKLNSCPGHDEIPPVFLKNCVQTIKEPLANLLNNIISTGEFPMAWKKAIVTPIYKKGNKQLAENYRPVSLTNALSKCMEKIITKELTDFFLETHIIPEQQHGFVPRKSTFTNLLTRLNEWTRADDNQEPTDVIYLDFEKAFDKIPIEFLKYKLNHYGVRGKLLQFIGDGFLAGRTFQVRVDSVLSQEHKVHSGVPQGSVLGPLLFIAYLSDLYQGLNTTNASFADDGNVYANPLLQHADLQFDLDNIKRWTLEWKMPLNDTKCTVLHIGKNNPRLNYSFGPTQITAVTKQKDLGIIITSDIKWETHITQMCKKANTMIYLIQKSFKDLSKEMVLKLYKSYVRPKLEYVQSIWNPYYVKDIELIERVQRRITKLPQELKDLSYLERLAQLNLTTLKSRRTRGDLVETFKILNNHYAGNLREIFHPNCNTNLRGHNKKLSKEKCNKLLRRNFLINRVVYPWNGLSNNTVNSTSKNQFKNRLDQETDNQNTQFIHYSV